MLFLDLNKALVDNLRSRVRNGELTERRLARLVGVSQPHIHNVLKGAKFLSPKLADTVLTHLRLTVLDLVPSTPAIETARKEETDHRFFSYISVLESRLGPGYPWPEKVLKYERFSITPSTLATIVSPVAVQLADDLNMLPVFSGADMALLDQSRHARTNVDDNGLYVVRKGRSGLVRRLRKQDRHVFIASQDMIHRPERWELLPSEAHEFLQIVRARATLLARDYDWITSAAQPRDKPPGLVPPFGSS